jgi:glycosyltransferase involved in cell wall biosynthesis
MDSLKQAEISIQIPIIAFAKSGGARVLSELANHWTRTGIKVTFLCANTNSTPYFPTIANIKYGDGKQKSSILLQFLSLRQLIKQENSHELLLGNHWLTVWACRAAGRSFMDRCLYYAQAYEPEYYSDHPSFIKKKILIYFSKKSYKLAPCVIANGPIYLKNKQMQAFDWVPPGINFSIFRSKFPRSIQLSAIPVIGGIGREDKFKGTHDILTAVRILKEKNIRVKLRLAYYIPEGYTDIQDYIEIAIPKNDEELADFYRTCDVIVAPGQIQLGALHYPVMEAMACKVPVITTGYLPANESNSFLVPIKNPEAIAESLIYIFDNYQEAISRSEIGFDSIQDFGWNSVSGKFIKILESFQKSIEETNLLAPNKQ